MLPRVTGEFRLAFDPELRFTPSGKAVANARIVANSRKKNEQTGEWVDDKACWVNLVVWDKMAENLAESFAKSDLIVVSGRLETRTYETSEGEKRTSLDLHADDIGVSVRWNAARSLKSERPATAEAAATAPAFDPWATPPTQTDEPPF